MTKYVGSNTTLAIIKEITEWVTPANPVFLEARYNDESLVDGFESTQSSLVSPTGDVSDLIRTGQTPSGGWNFDTTFNDATKILIESALRSTFVGSQCKAGTGSISFTIEKKITDGVTPRYFRTKGAKVNTLSFTADSSNGIVTGSVDIMARGTDASGTILSGATYTNAPLTDVFAFKDFVLEAFVGIDEVLVSSVDLSIATGLRVQKGRSTSDSVPDTSAKGVAYGQRAVTGTLTSYYSAGAQALYDAMKADKPVRIVLKFSNGTQFLRFVLPKCKISDAPVQSGGNDSDVQVAVSYQALLADLPALYNPVTVYAVGDFVSASDNKVYKCKTAGATGAGDNPATSVTKWNLYGLTSDYGTSISCYTA